MNRSNYGSDHSRLGSQYEFQSRLVGAIAGGPRRLFDLALDEIEYVGSAPHHASIDETFLQGDLKHFSGNFQMGRDVGVLVMVLDGIHHGPTEHVMHDAISVGIDVDVVPKRSDGRPVVTGM